MNNKKKILFILHVPPPIHGSSVVGKYIKESKLINHTFNSNFINLSTSKKVDEIGKNPLIKIGRYLRIIFEVIVKLFIFNPNVVYLTINAKGIGFYKDYPISLILKLFRKKIVLHYHNKGIQLNQEKFIDNLLYKVLFNNTKVILLSKILFQDVSKYVKKEDVFFCPNGILIPNLKKDKSLKKNKVPQLLFLSNLIESKGVFILLEALKILNDRKVKFRLNFVGGEGDISSNKLNQKIKEFNLQKNVKYLGKKYKSEKYKIFKDSNIFLFPTFYHNECFPLVLLEAMMFRLPIISTNEGGIPDMIVNKETGFIIEKKNTSQLAEKIKWLIDNPKEAELMGKKGEISFFKNYTLEIFEKRLNEILKSI